MSTRREYWWLPEDESQLVAKLEQLEYLSGLAAGQQVDPDDTVTLAAGICWDRLQDHMNMALLGVALTPEKIPAFWQANFAQVHTRLESARQRGIADAVELMLVQQGVNW